MALIDGRIRELQLLVIFRPKEGEGRNKPAGTDARDDLETRPRAGLGPAVEQARTEGTIRATARDGEVVVNPLPIIADGVALGRLVGKSTADVVLQLFQILKRRIADFLILE